MASPLDNVDKIKIETLFKRYAQCLFKVKLDTQLSEMILYIVEIFLHESRMSQKDKTIWFYCILSYVDFGPRDSNRRKGRSHEYRLPNWAEVKA